MLEAVRLPSAEAGRFRATTELNSLRERKPLSMPLSCHGPLISTSVDLYTDEEDCQWQTSTGFLTGNRAARHERAAHEARDIEIPLLYAQI